MKKKLISPGQHVQSVYYCSYILRIWREDAIQKAGWRITLEDPLTSERFGFASVEQLHKFLLDLIDNNQTR